MATATEARRSLYRSHKPSTRQHIDWRSAVGYVSREPSWKLLVAIGGLLILLLPPVGWVLALGYRSIVGQHIVDRQHPLPPPWSGLIGAALRRGAASSVILAYLTPFVIAYWTLGVSSFDVLTAKSRELLIFVAAVVAFPAISHLFLQVPGRVAQVVPAPLPETV